MLRWRGWESWAAARAAADSALQTDINTRVSKAGDTMAGALTLPGDPTLDLHTASKQYVDNRKTSAGFLTSLTGTTLNSDVGWIDVYGASIAVAPAVNSTLIVTYYCNASFDGSGWLRLAVDGTGDDNAVAFVQKPSGATGIMAVPVTISMGYSLSAGAHTIKAQMRLMSGAYFNSDRPRFSYVHIPNP